MAIYTTSSSAAGVRITASGSNSVHTILDGVALESTNLRVIEFSGNDGSLTVGGYAIADGNWWAVDVLDGAQNIIVNILESGHMFGGGILRVASAELIQVNFINAGNAYGNDLGYTGSNSVDKIINSGFLGTSASFAISTNLGDDEVYNSGTIQGPVHLGDSNDLFDGRGGTVIGTVDGGADDDTFLIDDETIILAGGSGNDTLTVFNSYDLANASSIETVLLGGEGDFAITGTASAETITGNSGDNTIRGGDGGGEIKGGGGNDFLEGGVDNDILRGETGDDELFGINGINLLNGGGGQDQLFGGLGVDTIGGGLGDDLMYGGTGADKMFGDGGADRMYGDGDDDEMRGLNDNDIVNGGRGNDMLFGGDGIDLMGGAQGNDFMYGDDGHDNMYGNGGDDRIEGGEGNDFMEGHDGVDTMRGDAGNDRLNGGLGNDNLTGGSGSDKFIFQNYWGNDIIADFENGIDIIDMSQVAGVNSFSDLTVTFSAGSTFIAYEGDEIRLFAEPLANIGAEDFIF